MRLTPRLLLTAAFAGVAALLVVDLWMAPIFTYRIDQPDFYVYYLAAQLGQAHGWAAIYDPSVFQPLITSVVGRYLPYLNPPLLAWLVTPLTWLPYSLAAWLWRGILVASLVLTWWLAARGARMARAVQLLAAAAALPVFVSLMFGQVTLVIIAGLATSSWLLRRDRPWLAGLLLATLDLKPQIAFLVPLALLVAGHWRVTLGWLAATVPLAALSLIAVGIHGLHDAARSLTLVSPVPGPVHVSLVRQVHEPAISVAAAALAIALALFVAWKARGTRPELPIAAGLIASVLISPYVGFYDLACLVLAAWLVLRANPPVWQQVMLPIGYVALYLAPVWPMATVVAELIWLASLAIMIALHQKHGANNQRAVPVAA
jgi:hypothetical protein